MLAERTTRAAQKYAATTASPVSPKRRKQATTRSAVASSTAGYRQLIRALQERQRPRRAMNETSGRLSYQAISPPHDMHAERGCTRERRSGRRAATTFRKLPSASAGAKTTAASASSTPGISAGDAAG